MFNCIIKITTIIFTSCYFVANCSSVKESSFTKAQLKPSHDAFIRKDKNTKQHGQASKITVTQQGSNQRIGLMKFNTADYDEEIFEENNVKAYLQLGVAETHSTDPVDIKVLRLENGFDENEVSWKNFDGDSVVENYVRFTVEKEHVNQLGQVDVSDLLVPGEDTVFAFVIEDTGHVKFHSKEHSVDKKMSPSLILTKDEL